MLTPMDSSPGPQRDQLDFVHVGISIVDVLNQIKRQQKYATAVHVRQ